MVSPLQKNKILSQFFQKHFRFYSRFSPISERVILFNRNLVTRKEAGLWDADKIKIRLPETEAQKYYKGYACGTQERIVWQKQQK